MNLKKIKNIKIDLFHLDKLTQKHYLMDKDTIEYVFFEKCSIFKGNFLVTSKDSLITCLCTYFDTQEYDTYEEFLDGMNKLYDINLNDESGYYLGAIDDNGSISYYGLKDDTGDIIEKFNLALWHLYGEEITPSGKEKVFFIEGATNE